MEAYALKKMCEKIMSERELIIQMNNYDTKKFTVNDVVIFSSRK